MSLKFLFNLHSQVQMYNWTSCYSPNTKILLALWIKITFQYEFVVMIHVLDFQVQMSNWTSCHRLHTWILFPLWFKTALQNDFCGDTSCPTISSPDDYLNFLSQSTHMNPVRSLIQNCSAKWHLWWYFMSFNFMSRCQIELLVTGHTHESCSLFNLKLLCKMTCGDTSFPSISSPDV